MTPRQEVAVVFRKGTSLIIPPFEVTREERRVYETFEASALRLSSEFGVMGSIDHALTPTKVVSDTFPRAYMIHPKNGELDRSEFLIHYDEVQDHVARHDYLSDIDKALIHCAHRLISLMHP